MQRLFSPRSKVTAIMKELKDFHLNIVNSLFPLNNPVYKHLEELFTNLENILASESSLCYDYEYDRIICFGTYLHDHHLRLLENGGNRKSIH